MDSDPHLIPTWHKMKVYTASHSTFLVFLNKAFFFLSCLHSPRSVYIRSKTFTKSCAGQRCSSMLENVLHL